MESYCVLLIAFSGLILVSPTYAGSWNITQETSVNDALSLSQSNTSNKSVQGIHQININNVTVASATQRMNMNGHNINLTQSNGASDSRQFINEINSSKVQQVAQSLANSSNITMVQSNANNNVQAANSIVIGSGALQASSLRQNANIINAVNFQQTEGANNIQAVNILQAATVTGATISQSVNGNSANYGQTNGQNNLQTLNATIISNGSSIDQVVTQSANFTTINTSDPYTPDPVTGNIRAINYLKTLP